MATKKNKKDPKEKFPGYPLYPENEDIYSQDKEETEIDPEFPDQHKKQQHDAGEYDALNELNFEDDKTGGDLDVPGTELDDEQEEIGNEDEENNLYSPAGDKD